MIKRLTQILFICLLSVISISTTVAQVTFTVDMSNYIGSLDCGVAVHGGFNGWCGDCAPLTDNGDGTWSITISSADILDGPHEFLFRVAGDKDQEMFAQGTVCTNTSFGGAGEVFTNRTITVAGSGSYTSVWNEPSAEDCEGNSDGGGPVTTDVTFTLDATCYSGPPSDLASGVNVIGNFDGWCGGCNPLTDNGDGTWSGTFNLPTGDYEFVYAIADSAEQLEDGSSCTLTTGTFTNRTLTVGATPVATSAGWNVCDADCSNIALPMELLAFDVAKDGKNALLEWSTASDDTENIFVVEHSRDAVNFKEIGIINGNTARGFNEYSFMHYLTSNGQNYYRLKNLDANEAVHFSDVRNLKITTATTMRITPTVSNSDINIQVDESHVNGVLFIYNILGEKVLEYNVSDTNFTVDVSNFTVGQYITVIHNGASQLTERFVKTY